MGTDIVKLGVDIGGTFTDVVLELADAQYSAKVLTSHNAPDDAIMAGVENVCNSAGIAPSLIGQVIHGTTLATNALIERRGAKTALITTEGFRDVIEMRTESRFEQYDLNLTLPPPLLARNHRLTVSERMDAQGNILIPLDLAKVNSLIQVIAQRGYESIAVGFIHSYVNGSHERQVRDALSKALPHVSVSLSSEVSPQMREYERFNTVVANAYVKPMMQSYLSRLRDRLQAQGVVCPIFLMHSGGGIIGLESAGEFPVRLVESGPAGGAIFAADIAARHGLDRVLSFDMGGTTAKICLIKNQTPKTSRVFEVARSYRFKKGSGMPISIPVIDMVEIGAGGGSLAHVDSLQQIRVGPQSAGSNPGPACYDQGGGKPAVTDADLVLGRLDADGFAGGTMPLSQDAARIALADHIGAALDLPPLTAAFGLSEVVDENMANAARVHAVENGEDLANYTMIAFGGAAPLHAGRLCEKLGIDRLLVPPGAGVGSAIGFLRAPFSYEANRSQYMRLSEFDAQATGALLNSLKTEATGFVRSCVGDAPVQASHKAYMRYCGQGWEIPIDVTNADQHSLDAVSLLKLFEADYSALFGRIVSGMDVEITGWAVTVATCADPPKRVPAPPNATQAKPGVPCQLFDANQGEMRAATTLPRAELQTGQMLPGPAILTESETTIIIPAGFHAIALPDGCIDIRSERPIV